MPWNHLHQTVEEAPIGWSTRWGRRKKTVPFTKKLRKRFFEFPTTELGLRPVGGLRSGGAHNPETHGGTGRTARLADPYKVRGAPSVAREVFTAPADREQAHRCW